jgi:serine/threonine protein kinase
MIRALSKPPALKDGQNIEGRYYVRKEIGKGSFAKVYSAFDTVSMEPVALKLLHNERRRMAARERRILHQLGRADQPNIIRLLRYFTADIEDLDTGQRVSTHVLAYPLLQGTLLDDIMEDRHARGGVGGLNGDKIEPDLRCMASGLAFLERQRIVHMDLKPENVLVMERPSRRLQLADFGNATLDIANESQYEAQTAWYRSPEVCVRARYGAAVDLWSLGCIVYEMEVGKPLFRGDTSEKLTYLHVRELGKPPLEFLEQEPGWGETGTAALDDRWLRLSFDGSVVCAVSAWSRVPRAAKPNPRSPLLRCKRVLDALLQWMPAQREIASKLLEWPTLLD